MSAVIEEMDGSMNVVYFNDFLQKMATDHCEKNSVTG
jgi:hypothetical protein